MRVGKIDYPSGLSEDRTAFKFFLNDVGLLTSRLMGKAELDVINGKTSINYGSIFEAVVAQELLVRGYAPHTTPQRSMEKSTSSSRTP